MSNTLEQNLDTILELLKKIDANLDKENKATQELLKLAKKE